MKCVFQSKEMSSFIFLRKKDEFLYNICYNTIRVGEYVEKNININPSHMFFHRMY